MTRSTLARRLESEWQTGGLLASALAPVSMIYRGVSALRRILYRTGALTVHPSALPVVVIGNLTVGGSGKTPLTAWLVEAFRARGWSPGIVSRGYGGERQTSPHLVLETDSASVVGDEPLMLQQLTGAPVCVCAERARAVAELARVSACDLVLSDDGLQHYAMGRDIEIVVIDAETGFGNGRLLPAGPLRENADRLYSVDALAIRVPALAHGPVCALPGGGDLDVDRVPPMFRFALGNPRARALHPTHGESGCSAVDRSDGSADELRVGAEATEGSTWQLLADFTPRHVHAVAGIARPERFFRLLEQSGLTVIPHALPDHHAFVASDLAFDDAHPVLVTSKDAAKLRSMPAIVLAGVHEVAVDLTADADSASLLDRLSNQLRSKQRNGIETA